MSLQNKVDRLSQTKASIKEAIEEKGVTVGNIAFKNYPTKISQITTGDMYRQSDAFNISYMMPYSINLQGLEVYGDKSAGVATKHVTIPGGDSKVIYIKEGVRNLFNAVRGTGLDGGFVQDIISITFPSTLKILHANSLAYCLFTGGARKITLNYVQTIESNAFLSSSLTHLEGLEVTSIKSGAFNYIVKLDSITMPKLTNVIKGSLQSGTVDKLLNATIGSSGYPVENIEVGCFGDSSANLTSITIYVEDPDNPGLAGAPWGATNATITYLQA